MTEWTELAEWWLEEIDDPAYAEEVMPMVEAITAPLTGRILDLGAGEGRVAAALASHGRTIISIDYNLQLLARAAGVGPAVALHLPDLSAIAAGALDGAYVVLALEHLHDLDAFFDGVARAVRQGGHLAVVLNHPVYTAPGSGPVLDPQDQEIYWRFGDYLQPGASTEPAGDGEVEFVHRPIGSLLNAAAQAGWFLEHVDEQGVGARAAQRDDLLALHKDIPHLMALRWRRGSEPAV
jgi:SAM-dependent methyltransferase